MDEWGERRGGPEINAGWGGFTENASKKGLGKRQTGEEEGGREVHGNVRWQSARRKKCNAHVKWEKVSTKAVHRLNVFKGKQPVLSRSAVHRTGAVCLLVPKVSVRLDLNRFLSCFHRFQVDSVNLFNSPGFDEVV